MQIKTEPSRTGTGSVRCGPEPRQHDAAEREDPERLQRARDPAARLGRLRQRTRRWNRPDRARLRGAAATRRAMRRRTPATIQARGAPDDRRSRVPQPEGGGERRRAVGFAKDAGAPVGGVKPCEQRGSRRSTALRKAARSRAADVRAQLAAFGAAHAHDPAERQLVVPRIARDQRGAVVARAQDRRDRDRVLASRSYQSPIASSAVPRGKRSARGAQRARRSNPVASAHAAERSCALRCSAGGVTPSASTRMQRSSPIAAPNQVSSASRAASSSGRRRPTRIEGDVIDDRAPASARRPSSTTRV